MAIVNGLNVPESIAWSLGATGLPGPTPQSMGDYASRVARTIDGKSGPCGRGAKLVCDLVLDVPSGLVARHLSGTVGQEGADRVVAEERLPAMVSRRDRLWMWTDGSGLHLLESTDWKTLRKVLDHVDGRLDPDKKMQARMAFESGSLALPMPSQMLSSVSAGFFDALWTMESGGEPCWKDGFGCRVRRSETKEFAVTAAELLAMLRESGVKI